jgi:hypothetical protein
MTTLEEHAKRLFNYHGKDTHACVIVWLPEDVKLEAERSGVEITDEEAIQILEDIQHNHDAEIGVSWLTLNIAINSIALTRKELP